ncbi:uncharacterized protein EI90DRAFT_3058136 [Cantharellus anzutake]|uniref:uncharacterized protein n=1 Tax=Cantharellus anzutake TaxID=1750568 RepID=UPI001908B099|nr:uncharacterized protein EI90DRAFT_3058136 [Cantharellus anzutake]KAF8331509.1 hypothetical protein EI90DRAFT_3058136 [Cantharellus anzutake]
MRTNPQTHTSTSLAIHPHPLRYGSPITNPIPYPYPYRLSYRLTPAAAANVGTSTGKRTTLLRRIWIVLFALCYLPYFASAQGTGTTSNSNNNGPSGTGSVNSTTFTSTALPPDMTTTLINITTSNWIPLPVVTQLTTSRTRIFTITTTTSIPLPTTITTISTISIATTTTTTTTNSTSTSSPSPTSRTPPPNNRWSSYFLLGFYAFSLGTCALVLRYGVIPHLRDDTDLPGNKEQGLYLLAALWNWDFLLGDESVFDWWMGWVGRWVLCAVF